MARLHKKLIVVNILGGLFYLLCLIQWLWTSLPYLPGFILFATKLQPVAQQPRVVSHVASTQPPSLFVIVLVSIIVVAILAATAYVLVKLPVTIGKTGEKLTKGASNYLVPVISHHAKLTPKKRRALAARVVIDLKLALCILPVGVAALGFATAFGITYDITMLVAAFLAILSLLLLSAQIGLARLFGLGRNQIW